MNVFAGNETETEKLRQKNSKQNIKHKIERKHKMKKRRSGNAIRFDHGEAA